MSTTCPYNVHWDAVVSKPKTICMPWNTIDLAFTDKSRSKLNFEVHWGETVTWQFPKVLIQRFIPYVIMRQGWALFNHDANENGGGGGKSGNLCHGNKEQPVEALKPFPGFMPPHVPFYLQIPSQSVLVPVERVLFTENRTALVFSLFCFDTSNPWIL